MSMTGYLLLRKELDGGSDEDNETVLYETKAFIPFAWSILFKKQDLREIGGDVVVAAKTGDAIKLARNRLMALESVVTKRLHSVLRQFLSSIDDVGGEWYVLDPYRIEANEAELTGPIAWFEMPDVELVKLVFGDDDGICLDEDGLVDVGDSERVAGWTVAGDDPAWFDGE